MTVPLPSILRQLHASLATHAPEQALPILQEAGYAAGEGLYKAFTAVANPADLDADLSQWIEDRFAPIAARLAWPDEARPEMQFGVRFLTRMRDLVATGFFTSEMGVNDLGYAGNRPNVWDGVPDEVLAKHGLSYDPQTLEVSLKPEEHDRIAEWDDDANIIR